MRICDHTALTFDCYGTLVDWESGILQNLAPLTSRAASGLTDDGILQAHAVEEASQQCRTPSMPYARLLAVVYRRLTEKWNAAASWDECLAYGNTVGTWPAFADSAAALTLIKRQYKLIILSNVDNQSFAASQTQLGVEFDAVFSAEDIGSYKPELRNFRYMLEHLGRMDIASGDILHVAESLFHDHVPAKQIGLNNCWIHRRRDKSGFGATKDPGAVPEINFTFGSMKEFADAAMN